MKKRLLCTLVLLLGFTTFLFAQAQSAILEYFEDNSGEFKVVTADGVEHYAVDLPPGWKIPVGSTVLTDLGDYAEISLKPNGTVIRLSQSTNFKVEALQGSGQPKNVFSVAAGKFRAVAAKGRGQSYTFKGVSAVCGVRGTDLGMEVIPGQRELAFVLDGVVDYTNGAGQTVALGAGEMADALADAFAAIRIPADLMKELLQGMEFQRVAPPQAEAPAEAQPDPEAEAASGPEAPADGGAVGKLLQVLGVEIGAVTLDDNGTPRTFAKAIVQPRFTLGKLKVALYLPIIYRDDLFDPGSWYHPQGNDEWSFGTDQEGWDRIALDAALDLFLKIRYVEYGEQRDPFFLKIGNIEGVNLGHGLIMRDYRNDTEFPSVRRIGLNLGGDGEKGGFELLVNDLADPQILATRLYTRPGGRAFPLALGFSAAADLGPGQSFTDYPDFTYGDYGRPVFLNAGLDLELPIVDRDALSIVLYTDAAAMLPYFRDPVAAAGIEEGFAFDAIWDADNSRPRNYGLSAGVLGNVLFLDYRLEYRYNNGIFRTGFYDAFYDRLRAGYAQNLVAYLDNVDDPGYSVDRMGIYGEAGFTLGKLLSFKAGYEWPWYVKDTGLDLPDDYFLARLELLQGLPVIRVKGSFSYERLGLVTTLIDRGSVTLFDVNTVFTGELQYPISPLMNLALLVSTTAVEDEGGDLKPFTSVSIVTRVNY